MTSVRMLAGGAVVSFALLSLTVPVRACDDRYITKCEAESAATFAAEQQQGATPASRRKGVRTHAVAEQVQPGRHHAPRFVVRSRPVAPGPTLASEDERPVTLPEVPSDARRVAVSETPAESPLSRRFRGFIDPQPMTVNSFEALRKPRLDPEHLTPNPTMPAMASNDMTASAHADEVPTDAAAAVVFAKAAPASPPAPDQVANAAMPIPVLAQNVEPSNDKPGGFPYHKLVFTLCCALGVASALRFIVRA